MSSHQLVLPNKLRQCDFVLPTWSSSDMRRVEIMVLIRNDRNCRHHSLPSVLWERMSPSAYG